MTTNAAGMAPSELTPLRQVLMRALLSISNAINALLRAFANFGGWFMLLLILVIVFDVITRKLGFQLWIGPINFGSTRLQELEWHLHAIIFCTWIGYTYVQNGHVRIDILTGGLSPRKQAWLELIGCIVFAAPYLYVALPYAWEFAWDSFVQNEMSAAPNGLHWRWIVKFFLFLAFVTAALSVVSVAFRRIVFLFGDDDIAREAMPPAAAH